MPSFLPLNNARAINSVDFNNQTPTNSPGLFRYKVNTKLTDTNFTADDLNAVCITSGGLGGVSTLNLLYMGFTPDVGAEIIFYSTTGRVKIGGDGGGALRRSGGVITTGANKVGKVIHAGNNVWYFSSDSNTHASYSLTNCCENGISLSQIKPWYALGDFDPASISFTDNTLSNLYNGIVRVIQPDTDPTEYSYYRIIQGVAAEYECTLTNFETAYTFYTQAEDPESNTTIYSVSGLDAADPETLLGNSFFNEDINSQYDCYPLNRTTSVTYYTNSTAPYYAVTFTDGYVTSYTSVN